MTKKPNHERLEQKATDRIQTGAALWEGDTKMRSIFHTAPVGIGVVCNRVFWEVNDRLCEITGYCRDELIGKSARMIYSTDEDYDYVGREKYRQIEEQGTGAVETRFKRKDGKLIDVLLSSTPLNPNNLSEGVTFTALDITDRKEAEEALQESEQRYKSLTTNLNVGVYRNTIGPSGKFIEANPAIVKMFGYDSREEFLSVSVSDLYLNPNDRQDYNTKMLHAGSVRNEELQLQRKGGTSFTGSVSAVVVKDENSEVKYYDGIIEDITERKHAEEALRESEERYRLFVQNFQGIAFRGRMDFTPIFFHGAVNEITGYTEREFLDGKLRWDQVIHPEDLPSLFTEDEKRLHSIPHYSYEREYRILCKDGAVKWVHEIIQNVCDESGKPTLLQGAIYDITERKQAEEELKESESRFRILFERSNDAIFVVDAQSGRYLDANKAAERLTGRTLSELVKLKTEDITPEGTAERLERLAKTRSERTLIEFGEVIYVRPDGTERIAILNSIPISDEIVFGIAHDITESKKAEEQLRQTQKMEAIGTLAGGIAHDFNNILTPFIGHTEMAMMDIPKDYPSQSNLKEALKAGYRARDLVKQILAFSRRQDSEVKIVKVSTIVDEAVKLLRASIPTTIEIKKTLMAESDKILADPTQIHQVIMNLCTNATHSMYETGGVLEVKTENQAIELNGPSHIGELLPGEYLKLTIRDTGHGMDQAVIQRILEPYYTTKDKQHGTGLGLSVVHGIVKTLQGGLTIDSQPGEGSTFSVHFPLADHEKNDREDLITDKELSTGNERILLVDDEKAMVDTVQSMLKRLGYNVTVRTSSIEALELFKNKQDAFDLIITDQTMPNMTGRELAEAIMSIRQDIPTILCTGYSEQIDETKAKAMGISAYVMKPILINEIAVVIREVLREKR